MSAEHALHVARHLREPEVRERVELWGSYDADRQAEHWLQCGPIAYAILAGDGEPVVVGGVRLTRVGQGATWMGGTDRWRDVVREATRRSREVIEAVLENGTHRVETMAPAWFVEAHRWYRLLGLERVAEIDGYGAHGEPWVMFHRLRRA